MLISIQPTNATSIKARTATTMTIVPMDLLQGKPCFSQFLYFLQTACQTQSCPQCALVHEFSRVCGVDYKPSHQHTLHSLKLLHSISVFYFLSYSSSPFSPSDRLIPCLSTRIIRPVFFLKKTRG